MSAASTTQHCISDQALAHEQGKLPGSSYGITTKQAAEAVDLDSTLAHHEPGSKFDPDHIGDPVPSMLRRVRNWLAQGKKVYILTARAANKDNIPRVEEWLKEHGIGECIVTNEKLPEMRRIWDNIAVAVESNTGKVLADATKSAFESPLLSVAKRVQGLANRVLSPVDTGKLEGMAGLSKYLTPVHHTPLPDGTPIKERLLARAFPDLEQAPQYQGTPDLFHAYLDKASDAASVHVGGHSVVDLLHKAKPVLGLPDAPATPPSLIGGPVTAPITNDTAAEENSRHYPAFEAGPVPAYLHQIRKLAADPNWHTDDAKYFLKDPVSRQNSPLGPSEFYDKLHGQFGNYLNERYSVPSLETAHTVLPHAEQMNAIKGFGDWLMERDPELNHARGVVENHLAETQPWAAGSYGSAAAAVLKPVHALQHTADALTHANQSVGNALHNIGSIMHKRSSYADKVIDGKTRWQRLYERRNPPPECPKCGKDDGEWLKEPGHCKCSCDHEYMDEHYAKGWGRPAATKAASHEEEDLLSHVGKQASISKFKKALNEAVSKGQVPGDMPFYVKGDHCVVNAGDWHERDEIAAAMQLAKKHFDDVEEENECACPADYDDVSASQEACADGRITHTIKKASQSPPATGPEAIKAALANLDLDKLEQEHRQYLKDGKVSKRQRAIQVLNVLEGLKRNKTNPEDLMISKVPVIPPLFRPFSVVGDSFVPGDANELYGDLFNVRSGHAEARKMFGEAGVGQERLHLYDAVKALYGYGDPVNPKTAANGVSGFMRQVTGVSPKFSIVQRKLISKPMDSVSRGVISIGADYGMDEIGLPKNQAWNIYKDYIQRRLVQGGMSSIDALRHIKERSPHAEKALMTEITPNPVTGWRGRPVIYARPPSWHKFNTLAGKPRLVDGDTIVINPYVTTGMTADFDGDTVTVHVPSLKESVDEAHDVLMPSKMLFSIRDQNKTMAVPKHEQVGALFAAAHRPAAKTHQFNSKAEAMSAIRANKVSLQDDIEFPDPSDAINAPLPQKAA